ncbi:MAG: nth [Bacteroidetes bacterium]|nr:nth [Bacteroidota bacterium]
MGRKTANVVLGQAFGIVSGIVVDTHVHRLSQRMGFTEEDTAEKIEEDLMKLFPKKDWIDVGSLLILHGRKTCAARKPNCLECVVRELCPSAEIFLESGLQARPNVLMEKGLGLAGQFRVQFHNARTAEEEKLIVTDLSLK